ncbi:DNA repair protein RadC [Salmonella enterica]|nr:DNA repair protein RadC [Salmonella enterica subsp. diarizonae serovar 42:l,v:1,5,7]
MSELTQQYTFSSGDKKLINRAIKTLEKQFMVAENAPKFLSPELTLNYLRLQLQGTDREHLLVLFLNNQNQLIEAEKLFSGSINHVEVHPRVIARKALLNNASSLILAHNHPSGNAIPSKADRLITDSVVKCLSLFDIRILDHIIIGSGNHYWSFAAQGSL